MSTRRTPPPDSSQDPRTSADLVFARLIAIFGAQKMGAMWSGAEIDEVLATWDEALAPYRFEALDQALRGLMQAGSAWPPNLPEFIALVEPLHKAILRREADQRALKAPAQPSSPLMPPDKARAALAELMRFAASKRIH